LKNVVYNNDNISSKEVTELVVRAKGLLISNGYLLLGNEDGTLQFPGGLRRKRDFGRMSS
jgi:hypothetical protein